MLICLYEYANGIEALSDEKIGEGYIIVARHLPVVVDVGTAPPMMTLP